MCRVTCLLIGAGAFFCKHNPTTVRRSLSLIHKLALIEIVVEPALFQKLLMRSSFDDATYLHDTDLVRVPNSA